MAVDREPRPEHWRAGLIIQQQREKIGLTQEGAFLLWQDQLITMGHNRKWPAVGAKFWGRIERGEASKQLSNIELHVVCDALRFDPEKRAELFAQLGLDITITSTEASTGDEIAKQISIYLHGRHRKEFEKEFEVMTDLTRYTVTDGPVKLTTEDLEELYEDARAIIERKSR